MWSSMNEWMNEWIFGLSLIWWTKFMEEEKHELSNLKRITWSVLLAGDQRWEYGGKCSKNVIYIQYNFQHWKQSMWSGWRVIELFFLAIWLLHQQERWLLIIISKYHFIHFIIIVLSQQWIWVLFVYIHVLLIYNNHTYIYIYIYIYDI